MKPPVVYYYKGVSGRIRFVTFDSKGWSNERLKVQRSSISGLKQFRYLLGKKVELNGHVGVIKECQFEDKLLPGKYVGDSKNLYRKDMLNLNHLVRVYWYTGMNYSWQPFFKLKLL